MSLLNAGHKVTNINHQIWCLSVNQIRLIIHIRLVIIVLTHFKLFCWNMLIGKQLEHLKLGFWCNFCEGDPLQEPSPELICPWIKCVEYLERMPKIKLVKFLKQSFACSKKHVKHKTKNKFLVTFQNKFLFHIWKSYLKWQMVFTSSRQSGPICFLLLGGAVQVTVIRLPYFQNFNTIMWNCTSPQF